MRKSKVYEMSDEEFRKFIAEHNSWCSCARDLGMSIYGGNSRYQLSKRCDELKCDTSHFGIQPIGFANNPGGREAQKKYTLEEILVENSTYKNISAMKRRILDANLLEYKCAICGNNGRWNDAPLVLQIDHINGNHSDHRLENLRFLCPNCHSQTETYSGKNKPYKDTNV